MVPAQNKVYELIAANQRMRGFPSLSNLFLKDPDLLPELVELSTSTLKHPFPEYASWLLSHVSKQAPDLVQPYYKKILPTLLITSNETVKRNLLGVVKYLPLLPFKEGELLSILLTWIADPACKPAVFMYGMEIVILFCKKYPELYHEVEEIIKLRTTHPITPAMAATLKRFKKLGNVKKSKTKGS
jgi:hypothetical protein